MSFLVVKSIPLSQETQNAWRTQGASFLKRSRDGRVPEQIARRQDFIINLGNTNFVCDDRDAISFNCPDTIRAVSHPVNLRKTFADTEGILPARTITGPHWHKRGGFGGRGKLFHEREMGDCGILQGDVQEHLEGEEFRVNTVGDVVVQATRKEHVNGLGTDFVWNWVGVDGIKRSGIIPLVKRAMEEVPFSRHTVFGWDILVCSRGPRVLEINTSPGVNTATAKRIVEQIQRSL